MKNQVEFGSPQNIFGVSQQNSVAAFSKTTDVDEDLNLSPSRHGDRKCCVVGNWTCFSFQSLHVSFLTL